MATHSFALDRHRAIQPLLVFRWDPDTGEVTGPHAEFLRAWLDATKRGGVIEVAPWALPVVDPYHSALEFAAVLAQLGYEPLPEPFGSALRDYRASGSAKSTARADEAVRVDA